MSSPVYRSLPDGVHRNAQLNEQIQIELRRLIDEAVQARGRLGISQTELARRVGTSQAQVSKLEGGEHVPMFDTLIAHVLGLGGRIVLEFSDDRAVT